MNKKKIIVTGSCGFIGFHVCRHLIENNFKVIGIDNLDNYYNVKLKIRRLNLMKKNKSFKFYKKSILDKSLNKLIRTIKPSLIINLAAQPGVRYSFKNPQKYIDTNIKGFLNILEIMRENKINKLIYASSSSVYGNSNKFPTKEKDKLKPENVYGLTKVFNENLAEFYCKKFKINSVGLRFFTVYGKIGRPDMFIPKIIRNVKKGKPIYLFNSGNHYRDFTYVDDVSRVIFKITKKILSSKKINHNVFNVSYGSSIKINILVKQVFKLMNKKVKIINKKFQLGDMYKTYGDNKKLKKSYNFNNSINYETGIRKLLKDKDY